MISQLSIYQLYFLQFKGNPINFPIFSVSQNRCFRESNFIMLYIGAKKKYMKSFGEPYLEVGAK